MMPRDRSPGVGLGWLGSLVLAVVVGLLLFVISQEMRSGHVPVLPSAPHVDCTTRLSDLTGQIVATTALLQETGLPLAEPVEEKQGADRLRYVHRRYELTLPPAVTIEELKRRLAPLTEHDPCVSVDVVTAEGGASVQIGIDEVLTHTLVVRWVTPTPPRVRVGMVIDDLGNDLLIAREITTIDAPIGFAVIPFRPFSKEVAELAHLFDREVLVHLPMEAEGGHDVGEARVLRTDAHEADVQQLLAEAIESVPHAVGVSNHMGSRFTRDRQRMYWVLSWLKGRDLFFLDSLTTGESVVTETAASLGVAVASRAAFLDNVQEDSAIREQLEALVTRARERGAAIGIGHPYAVTITALRAVLPAWREAGVEIVPVSTLAQTAALATK